jgi:Tfp pilus assembly protein PilF
MAAGQRDVATDLFAEALSLDPNSAPARRACASEKRALS